MRPVFAIGQCVHVARGKFRPAIGKRGRVTARQWVETTYATGYVYTVQLDEPLSEQGREANGFLFNEDDLEEQKQ